MNPIKIGLLGLGTVGQGTWSVLQRNAEEIARRTGQQIQIKSAAIRDIEKARALNYTNLHLTTDPETLIDDPEIDIVVEVMGGCEPARALVLRAINQGKHIVTANKALIALHGEEIFSAAHKKDVIVAYEAGVAGGIPIVKAIRESLVANRIQSLVGIINGTSNFILTEMREKGRDFTDVLQEAQALGYAEADPTFDVEGIDAAHKLTILASIAFGIPLQFDAVFTEGISRIAVKDIEYAEQFGYHIKHLGIAKQTGHGIELRVHPTMIPAEKLIASVNGVMNAVLVNGDAAGPILYYGAGAGSEPTASAVIADIVDLVRMLDTEPGQRVPHLAFQTDALLDKAVLDTSAISSCYYLRLGVEDRVGVMAEITDVLRRHDVSIEVMVQKETDSENNTAQVVLMTHLLTEGQIDRAIAELKTLESVRNEIVRIRVESM